MASLVVETVGDNTLSVSKLLVLICIYLARKPCDLEQRKKTETSKGHVS